MAKVKAPKTIAERTVGEVLYRQATLEGVRDRQAEVSFSSETDSVRFWGNPEILLHEPRAVDFSGLREVGAVLFNHDPRTIVGRPTEVRLDKEARKGRATIVFDDDEDSERVWKKVEGGSLRGVSAGFIVDQWQRLGEDDKWTSPEGRAFTGPADIAIKWRVLEISLTPIPADASVGIGRSFSEELMKNRKRADQQDVEAVETVETPNADAVETRAVAPDGAAGQAEDAVQGITFTWTPTGLPDAAQGEAERGRIGERERIKQILSITGLFPATRDLAQDMIVAGTTVEDCRRLCLEKLAAETPKIETKARTELGEDQFTKWIRSAEDWLLSRTAARRQLDETRLAAAREIGVFSLLDLAREYCRQRGLRTGYTPDSIVETALRTRAMSHTSSDFPYLLQSIATKNLLAAYNEAPATYQPLVRTVSVPDFKQASMVRLGDAGLLELTPDGAPMPESTFAENRELYSIATYSKRFGITRQTIINDDLSAFDRIPQLMGIAARRLINQLFWDLLTSASGVGPTMAEDSEALFSASHTSGSNYTASAFAIDITNLSAARALLRKQKGLAGTGETAPILNVTPTYIVVPAALEAVALQAVAQITPAAIANAQPNWIKQLQVVVEPILDGKTNGTTAWYLAGAPSQFDGFVMAFLNGREEPTMVEVQGTNILGVEWGVYIDAGVKCVDHRAWYRAKGA